MDEEVNNKNLYENYMSNHSGYNKVLTREYFEKKYKYFNNNLGFLKIEDKNIKILEIGGGPGYFSYFLRKNGFKDYVGVDICKDFIDINKKKFKDYNFIHKDILVFFKDNKQKFDIIFMSHVFEHFSLNEGKILLVNIRNSLSDNGKLINIMPNASSLFNASLLRYNDITHKILYNENSFNQILKEVGFRNINHYNHKVGFNYVHQKIQDLMIKLMKVFLLILGYSLPRIYSEEMISIVKKNE